MKRGMSEECPITLRDEDKLVEGRGRAPLGRALAVGVASACLVVLVLFLRGTLFSGTGKASKEEGWRITIADRELEEGERASEVARGSRPRPYKASVRPFEFRDLDYHPSVAPRRAIAEGRWRGSRKGSTPREEWTAVGYTDARNLRSCWFDWECEEETSVATASRCSTSEVHAEREPDEALSRVSRPRGRSRVEVTVVRAAPQDGRGGGAKMTADPRGVWAVQVRAYREARRAREYVELLKKKGFRARIERHVDQRGQTWHRVRIGRFTDLSRARAFAHKVAVAIGDEAIVVALDVF